MNIEQERLLNKAERTLQAAESLIVFCLA